VFITLEGGDGVGKSTLAGALADRLRQEGYTVCLTGEPAGTELGSEIKSLFSAERHGSQGRISALAELLRFEAARNQHLHEVIQPALNRGEVVLCDRFADSSIAYQGYGRGLDCGVVRECNQIATGGLTPDLTLLLDIQPEEGLARARGPREDASGRPKAEDSIGGEPLAFHRRIREGFLALAREEPLRFVVIDAAQPEAAVTELAWEVVQDRLARTPV